MTMLQILGCVPIRVALLVMALIELASAQTQEDWLLAKSRAETVFENVNLEITNPPREPLNRIAMCRRLLPQVDDAFRVAMAYSRAVDAGEQATVQRKYDAARRLLLQIMGAAQIEIDNASQATVSAKEPVAQASPTPQMPPVAIEGGGEKSGGVPIGVWITLAVLMIAAFFRIAIRRNSQNR